MKMLLISLMCAVLFGCQSQTQKAQNPELQTGAGGGYTENPTFIGMVENGTFKILLPKNISSDSLKLTSIGMQMAVPPETGEIKLTKHEGTAIAVQGHYGGGWIYSAKVVDTGSPIVTALALQVFDQ